MLVATELPRLVRMLRLLKNHASPFLTFKFEFQIDEGPDGPPSEAVQKAVMEPLRPLGFLYDKKVLRIHGITDPACFDNITDSILSRLTWARAAAWSMYDLMASVISMAETAYRPRKWDQAINGYTEALDVIQTGCWQNPDLDGFDDMDFRVRLLLLTRSSGRI